MTGSLVTGYLAPADYVAELCEELGTVRAVHGRLVLADGPPRPCAFVHNVWYEPQELHVQSIGDAARQLRALQRNWAGYAFQLHRRTQLITERLPHVSAKPLVFPEPPPSAPLGSWTLLDANTMLAAPRCSSPFPHGEARFVEDREGPPSRAYLKLQEALTLLGTRPAAGELCLDAGSSPGGWTWVLQRLGARVLSVDKAPLEARIAALPGIEQRRESAFALGPEEIGPIDWFFSDVVCYPRRLLQLVRRWLEAGACERFVCTIKFQGRTELSVVREFAAISGSRIVHLANNKHEVTWMRVG